MKVKLSHANYIANKIAIDLHNSEFVTLFEGLEPVIKVCNEHIENDIKKEISLEARVNELINENEDDMEFMRIDGRSMFWQIKKKLAKEYDVVLNYEERYSILAHTILKELWDGNLIDYTVVENRIKNIVFEAIMGYVNGFSDVEYEVTKKIEKMKRELHPGTPEYDLVFAKLYEELLRKQGLLLD